MEDQADDQVPTIFAPGRAAFEDPSLTPAQNMELLVAGAHPLEFDVDELRKSMLRRSRRGSR